MRPSARHAIFGFILAIGTALILPNIVFGADHSFRASARFRAPKIHRQQSFSRPFHRPDFLSAGGVGDRQVRKFRHGHPGSFGFSGVGGVTEQEVVIIQQFPSAPAVESKEPAKNRVYVAPRWVDSEYGVQVLEPGYWTDPKQAAGR